MPAHSSLRHPKKTLLKASSFDVLRQLAFDTENASSPGPSNLLNQHTAPRRPASSGNLIDQIGKCGEEESSLAFQVGNASKYDVFTDPSASGTDYKDSTSKGTEDSLEEASPDGEAQASQRNANWALVPREPPQIDAQDIYPSSACVFVANLTQAFDDRRLEIEVTKYFSQYGTVFVKIRRDSRQMPFAFCQFTCDADAENAAHHGNGAVILGRPCRVEKATAHSCYVVYKLSGAETTRQEAIDLLGPLGPIAKVHPLDLNSQKTFPPAMVVHYKRYDSSRAVVKTFEEHPVFRVEAYDPKAELRQQHKRSDQQSYAQYEKDRRSAYFGNLPLNMAADVLKTLASQCGNVLCAEVATKKVPQAGGRTATTCFGFVEFVRPDAVDNAIMNYHRKPIDGHIIKVERKRTRTFNGSSYGTNGPQRGSFARMPSTWHGGKGGNGHGSRIMDANTFVPPAAGLSASFLPQGAKDQGQDGSIALSTQADGSPRLARIDARRCDHSMTSGSAISEANSGASVAFAIASNYSHDAQLSDLDYEEASRPRAAVDDKSINKRKEPVRDGKPKPDIEAQNGVDRLKPLSTTTEAAAKAVFHDHAFFKSEPNEHSSELDGGETTQHEARDGSKPAETPTKCPMKPGTRTPQAYGAESAASCFYPLIHPYPCSPYGFHPIQPLMANPITPQGGPIMYNTFGQAYYSPTPYSDMFTMYPMMQQYPSGIVETPTRPSMPSNGIEGRQETMKEANCMLPEVDKEEDGNGKENAF
ncbi:hypothetical protein CCMA1212_004767 [Trichoderma ghanense]|uniref:RRM domain-containing protein n=1 Tax=Trichoderma ghanense TaxID=65468 RepID=A0ABY2H609_9HYPO